MPTTDSPAALRLIASEAEKRGGEDSGDAIGAGPLRDLPLSETWNGHLFAYQWGKTTRFNHEKNEWVVYLDGRWQIDKTGEVDRRAGITIDSIPNLLIVGKSYQDLHSHYFTCLRDKQIEIMKRRARSLMPCTSDQFDTDPMILSVKNGTIDCRTGQLRPSCPEDMVLKQAPVMFDPDAKAERLSKAVEYSMGGDKKMIAFLWRMAGLWLTGDVGDSAFFVLYGSGQNGKGTFVSTMTSLLGFDYSTFLPVQYFLSSRMQDSAMPIDVHEAKGKRLVVVSENERNARFNTGKIKLWTGGGDIITGKGMRENLTQNVPTLKLLLQTNNYPQFNDNSKAFRRRLRVVPFLVQVPDDKVDGKLKDFIKENELSGVLNLALAGLADWRTNGLAEPDSVKKASSDLLAMQDVLSEFADDYLELTENPMDLVQRGTLYEAYEHCCTANHEKPMSRRSFIGAMKDREGLTVREHVSGSWRGWKGLKLRAVTGPSSAPGEGTGGGLCRGASGGGCPRWATENGLCASCASKPATKEGGLF